MRNFPSKLALKSFYRMLMEMYRVGETRALQLFFVIDYYLLYKVKPSNALQHNRNAIEWHTYSTGRCGENLGDHYGNPSIAEFG